MFHDTSLCIRVITTKGNVIGLRLVFIAEFESVVSKFMHNCVGAKPLITTQVHFGSGTRFTAALVKERVRIAGSEGVIGVLDGAELQLPVRSVKQDL